MKVIALTPKTENMPAWFRWRIAGPFEYLSRVDSSFECEVMDVDLSANMQCDILILPRLLVEYSRREETLNWLSKIKAQGTKVVYEIDDDIFSEHYVSQMIPIYIGLGNNHIMAIIQEFEGRRLAAQWMVQQCDAVTTTTQPLADCISEFYSGPIYVVPNAIDKENFILGLQPKRLDEKITIGWAGSMRSQNDLTIMLQAWKTISRIYGSRVQFIVAGWMPDSLANDNTLQLGQNLTYIPWTKDNYSRSMQVDIGCCAVADNLFTERKTTIKAWEYVLAGAAPVCSKTLYESEPVATANSVEEWISRLIYYIDGVQARDKYIDGYRAHVLANHTLERGISKWADTYRKVVGCPGHVET